MNVLIVNNCRFFDVFFFEILVEFFIMILLIGCFFLEVNGCFLYFKVVYVFRDV